MHAPFPDNLELLKKFISSERKEDFEMLATKNTYIQSAYKTLQVIRQDDQKRMEYEARQKALRDYNQGMLEAEERGRETGEREKAIQIAKNMIAIGLPTDIITQATGLSIAQIESFR